MAQQDTIKRQFLIIGFLRKRPASFNEIIDYLQEKEQDTGFNLTISQRTFQRDCNEILSLWNIDISYNKRKNVYEIADEDDNPHIDRIMEAFDMVSVLNQSKKLDNYIYLENRKSKGTEFFNGIVYAIQNNFSVTFTHQSYWHGTKKQRNVVPKAIKESQNRYYLIAWDLDKKDFRNFGLDRISNFTVGNQKHISPKINVEEYYQHTFGIERYHDPVKIVLEFDNDQKEYVKSLPFHSSQKITKETKTTFELELFMHPTNDFVMEILRYGAICEVKEPLELREDVHKRLIEALGKYQK
ncbi:WYL domain-containing protein [Flavobacterium dauae]|uniref:helix-turn-helix transcriptional regulator n=1 Tax=Flavobacterium dauae TaxID=1563479 RepID=UPI00101B4264|nr:WYL domain-containing protein [Flavobacterium dauae]WLD25061.1 WYL domain-containing protein [Flavobacterium dauae]